MGLLDWIAGKSEYPPPEYPRRAVVPSSKSKGGHEEVIVKDRVHDSALNLKHSGNVVYLPKSK